MKFQLISLFPELFEQFSKTALLGSAIDSGKIEISTTQLRDFAINERGQVDDSPFGGGSGMVLRPEPALEALQSAKVKCPETKTVLMSPRGEKFTQKLARDLASKHKSFTVLCPRYEGIDQRAEEQFDYKISMGDYICMGGEVPAMAFMEAISRLVPGVLGNASSTEEESFENGSLEYPQFTKPRVFDEKEVPEVLLSGNHEKIKTWRKEKSALQTFKARPDLGEFLEVSGSKVSIALIHHPVLNKQGDEITSSLTNLDISDIARSAKTYSLENFYIVHPTKTLRRLAENICEHWESGFGSEYNKNRKEALAKINIVSSLDEAIMDMENCTGSLPQIISTSAKVSPENISYQEMRGKIALSKKDNQHYLILLGTGWGLAERVLNRALYHLAPINGWGPYNHLSVRAAAAIILDRLFGKKTV